MDHLDEITLQELRDALETVEESKPTQRLLAAIAYKNGITQTELAEWYGVERRTIYSWLKRFDTNEPIDAAVSDAHRPGRPRKLSGDELAAFENTLHNPPKDVGYDDETWSPALVQQYLKGTYGVEYSVPSCRRLLNEAGL